MAIGRVNTGGGGAGGELTINAPAGVTVTAVHSTTQKTYTKTANADGVAVFKGLPEGTYNVTISDGTTTTEPVSVVVAYKAETTVAFFQATINVTYPAGSTCTCTCGDVSFTAPNTSGTWACIVPNAGTWTVTATDGEYTKAVDVVIAAAGETKTVNILYDLYLYNSGDTCAAVTGGWGVSNMGAMVVKWNADNFTVTYSGYSNRECTVYTRSNIASGAYDKLKIMYTSLDTWATVKFGFSSNPTAYNPASFISYVTLPRGENLIGTLDISSAITAHVSIDVDVSQIKVYKIWLDCT